MNLPVAGGEKKTLVKSDEFDGYAPAKAYETTEPTKPTEPEEPTKPTESQITELVKNGEFEGEKGTEGWQAFESADVATLSVAEEEGNKILCKGDDNDE